MYGSPYIIIQLSEYSIFAIPDTHCPSSPVGITDAILELVFSFRHIFWNFEMVFTLSHLFSTFQWRYSRFYTNLGFFRDGIRTQRWYFLFIHLLGIFIEGIPTQTFLQIFQRRYSHSFIRISKDGIPTHPFIQDFQGWYSHSDIYSRFSGMVFQLRHIFRIFRDGIFTHTFIHDV